MHISQILPKKHMSLFVGWLMHAKMPSFLKNLGIYMLIKIYKINVNEAEFPPYSYSTIGEFFVRRLKTDSRPIGRSSFVHPADADIRSFGPINTETLIQAKGKNYDLTSLIDNQAALDYRNGTYAVYYLCPGDYHRVHSPVSGTINRIVHIPGTLWPVNDWSVNNIDKLFAINERVYVEIMTEYGLVGLVLVGATNVGHIQLLFDDSPFKNNQNCSYKESKKFTCQIPIMKGQELGAFRMGSTVIVIYNHHIKAKLQLGFTKVNDSAFDM